MAERYWEHVTRRHHSYIDGDTGKVIGTLYERLADRMLEATAYDRRVGDFARVDAAYTAVEAACVAYDLEAQRAAAAAAKAAQGTSP